MLSLWVVTTWNGKWTYNSGLQSSPPHLLWFAPASPNPVTNHACQYHYKSIAPRPSRFSWRPTIRNRGLSQMSTQNIGFILVPRWGKRRTGAGDVGCFVKSSTDECSQRVGVDKVQSWVGRVSIYIWFRRGEWVCGSFEGEWDARYWVTTAPSNRLGS